MPKILIIEDDALTAKVYREFLERSSFEVDVETNGAAALQRIEKNGPDAIVVDIIMPTMNGIEFMKRLRAIEQYKSIPVLAYTTAFIPHLIQEAKAAGANEVFDKAKLNGPLLKNALQQYLPAS
jgi:two-component system, cell cycle response regulator DivK